MNRILCSVVATLPIAALASFADETRSNADVVDAEPLAEAHAHNDYYHPRPCLDALAHGFTSVEADIFLVDGALLVGHSRDELRRDRTLERLYLDPLRARVARNGGRVFKDTPSFTLLIDLKSEGETTYRALSRVLAGYADMLTTIRDGKVERKAVTVVISGNRPHAVVAAERVRYSGIDGRLPDLDAPKPVHLMPLISDRWTSHFKWRGEGAISAEERAKLRTLVRRAHERGQRIRFWATADVPAMWEELLAAGVDHINTDDLCGLQRFLLSKKRKGAATR